MDPVVSDFSALSKPAYLRVKGYARQDMGKGHWESRYPMDMAVLPLGMQKSYP